MKKDKLEDFVISNRNEFDEFEPREELWDRIQQKRKPVRKLQWRTIAWQAAAAVAIFISSYFFFDVMNSDPTQSQNQQIAEQSPVEDEKMQMLMEAEMFYTSKINSTKEELFHLSGNDNDFMKDLDLDLEELDEVFNELKKDLKDNTDNEEVIEAMVQNYRLKLTILEEILLQVSKSSNKNENTNDYEI